MYSKSKFLHNFSAGPSPSPLGLVGGWGGQKEQVNRTTLWLWCGCDSHIVAHGEEDPALPTHPGMSWVQEVFICSIVSGKVNLWLTCLTPHSSEAFLLVYKWGLGAAREVIALMSCLLNKQYLSPGVKCFKPLDWNAAGNSVNAHCRAHLRNWFDPFQIEGFSVSPGLHEINWNFQGLLSYISMKKFPSMQFRCRGRNWLLSLGWFRAESKPAMKYLLG